MKFKTDARRCLWEDLVGVRDELARRGRPGSTLFRTVMSGIGPGLAVAESALEVRGLSLLEDGGMPEPVQQYPFPWREAGEGRIDLAYPEARVIVELDGRRWHSRTDSFNIDRERDRAAQLAGGCSGSPGTISRPTRTSSSPPLRWPSLNRRPVDGHGAGAP